MLKLILEAKMKKTIAILILFSLLLITACSSTTDETSSVNDEIKIPLSDITEEITKYTLKSVTYFAVLGSDGEVKTAFDACDICGGKKGYSQSGDDVMCNNCGRFFSIDSLGTENKGGGCWPLYLSHKIEGDNIILSTKEIKSKAYMF
ncbi:hypothetical protein CL616_04655 [archaeon]|nr:hypothetical protein [archaeon]